MQRPHPTLGPRTSSGPKPRPARRFSRGSLGLAALLLGILTPACLDEAQAKEWVLHESSVQRLTEQAPDPTAAQAAVEEALERLYGTALAPHWPMVDPSAPAMQSLAETAAVYRDECAHCHGLEGYGNGPSSPFLNPKPWNFSLGVFPRSAPGGGEPKLDALVQLLEDGIPSSAMPKFGRLGAERLREIGGYVLLLTQRSRLEHRLVEAVLAEGPTALEGEGALQVLETMRAADAQFHAPANATQEPQPKESAEDKAQ